MFLGILLILSRDFGPMKNRDAGQEVKKTGDGQNAESCRPFVRRNGAQDRRFRPQIKVVVEQVRQKLKKSEASLASRS